MLELRPSCELCEKPLDPLGDEARICTYECTFCERCATVELLGICPNCTGELVARPRRPAARLLKHPASTVTTHQRHDVEAHRATVAERLIGDDLPRQVWTVAFCNQRTVSDGTNDGYDETAEQMDALAAQQPGYLGIDSARSPSGEGITVSRWSSIAAMVSWRRVAAHAEAQRSGTERWYAWYRSDVARVDRTSEFHRDSPANHP